MLKKLSQNMTTSGSASSGVRGSASAIHFTTDPTSSVVPGFASATRHVT